MSGWQREKRLALALSLGVHAVIFGLLAAGGLFSFLQTHSQAPPVDVTVYNEDAETAEVAPADSAPAASGGSGGGETYAVPTAMPAISEAYTQAAQEERFVRKVMAEHHVDAATAKQLAAAQQSQAAAGTTGTTTAATAAGTVGSGSPSGGGADGASGSGGTGSDAGSGGGTGTGAGSGAGTGDSSGNGGQRPAKKARLISQPDVSAYYPETLRRQNITGTVTVHIVISADGTVTSADVAASSGYGEMDAAAVRLAYQCRYEPAENEYGQAVAAERNLKIPFGLL